MSIVITGNPGVGKHTITQKISQKLNFPIIDINTLAKESEVIEKQENTNDVDTIKLANIVKKIELNEKIIVGHLAPYVVEKNQVKLVIILRRNPYHLETVYKERNYLRSHWVDYLKFLMQNKKKGSWLRIYLNLISLQSKKKLLKLIRISL